METAGVPYERLGPRGGRGTLALPALRGRRGPPAIGRAVPGRRHGRRAGSAAPAITGPTCVSGSAPRPSASAVRSRVRVSAGEEVGRRTAVVTAGGWVARTIGPASPRPASPAPAGDARSSSPTSRPRWSATSGSEWASFIHHAERFWYGLTRPGVGLKVGGHHEGDVIDPDGPAGGPDPSYVDGLVRYVEEWVPGVATRADGRRRPACTRRPPTSGSCVDRRGPLDRRVGLLGPRLQVRAAHRPRPRRPGGRRHARRALPSPGRPLA